MRVITSLCILLLLVSLTEATYYTTCIQSLTRTCVYGTNITDRLLSLKKGGSNIPSINTFDPNFFLCEEYDYNCGFLEQQNDFLTIANGMQLNMSYSELLNIIPSDATLTTLIKPYLNSSGSSAMCLNNYFPLILTDTQSNTAMSGYLSRLSYNLSAIYAVKKAASTPSWSTLNINVITAVLEMTIINFSNGNFLGSTFWNNLLAANYTGMSSQLKANYSNTSTLAYLRSAYLIDSITQSCDKYQSVNFLVDESAAIGSSNFNYAKTFLTNYVTQTKDDPTLMSINYYDATFDSSIGYGNSQAAILSRISSKTYRGSGSGNLGNAINNTISQINAAGFANGVPKLLVLLVGSSSLDDVYYASEYARAVGITIIAVGIGSGFTNSQLLQVAYTQSNLIYLSSYSAITTFHTQLPNVLAHQYTDIALNSTLSGGMVRNISYPNYYRLPRDSTGNSYYYMTITYGSDPTTQTTQVLQSHYDPFPDTFSNCNCSQVYRVSVTSFQYYIAPVVAENVTIKKNISAIKILYYTYFTIGGNNLTYNITIKNCTTNNCTEEIAAAQRIGSLNVDQFNAKTNGNANSNDPNSLTEDDVPSNVVDPSIFLSIGGGMVALAVGTYAAINGLRKFRQSPEQPAPQADNTFETNQDLEANHEDNLIGPQNQNKIRRSHKRSFSQRRDNLSDRSHSGNRQNEKQDNKSSWDDDSQCYVQDKKKLEKKKNQEQHSHKSQRQSQKRSHNQHSERQKKSDKDHSKEKDRSKKRKSQKNSKNGTPEKQSKNRSQENQKNQKQSTPEKQKRKHTPENKDHKN